MRNLMTSFCLLLLAFPLNNASAQTKPEDKPIKALLVTGGCCHDYARQKLILTRGISARANVVWTVVQQGGTATNSEIPLYKDEHWADGFDIVVHNECFSDAKDPAWVERILKPHREGTPAMLIHCAMHCYRTGGDQWFEFVGLQSPGHGPHFSYKVENLKPDHPIMSLLPDNWEAPKGELYHSIKLWPSATPLGQARRISDNQPQTCIWTNEYGKSRVFCTTIGHYNETMAQPGYLDMVTRGLLWAVKKNPDDYFHATDEKTNAEILKLVDAPLDDLKPIPEVQECCREGNLAFGKPSTASSEETGKQNFSKNAVDGNLNTRWCANGSSAGQWWQVDLGQPEEVSSLRIHWEKPNVAYRYKVEGSADGKDWKLLVDQSGNKKKQQINPHQIKASGTRYLRVTFLGTRDGGYWGSFWEFEAYAGELPKLPESLSNSGTGTGAPTIADVKAPAGFQVTLFGTPPEINYPVCLTTAPTGEVFIGVDEQGSLGKAPGKGKVLRCLDTDGDGKADKINVFAKMDHPRGLVYDHGSLWVLHPPFLTLFHDDDLDGTADREETLITGISTDQVNKRGADHTTNGIRMGIDGWIYIAVGDFGFTEAKGTDVTVLSQRGGGVVRVRPDGTEMEIYSWGQRNIVDVSIDPLMNLYTRDNTNDGGGWNIRVSHIMQSANYGYPSLYMNFTNEIMPPLANYGGGSGCGSMFFQDARWPEPFANALYTCDWGRNEIYRHNLSPDGATFAPHQEVFLKLERPTDMDVDGSGRMYVASWKNGKFDYSGPDVGFVAQITPIDYLPKPFPELSTLSSQGLLNLLTASDEVHRLHAQREILRRGDQPGISQGLIEIASNQNLQLAGRVAAIFTLKQLAGVKSNDALLSLSQDPDVREFALRALTDRKSQLKDLPTAPFVSALNDSDPRVQAQALICLGRLGRPEVAEAIIPLTVRKTEFQPNSEEPLWDQPDSGRVIPHLAVRALETLGADEACVKALGGPYRSGALWALKYLHTPKAVDGLFQALSKAYDKQQRKEILTTLIRLYHREGDYTGSWWGTRPDTTGPYYDRKPWSESPRIAAAITVAVNDSDKETAEHILKELARHLVKIEGLPGADRIASNRTSEPEVAIVIPKIDPGNPDLLGNQPVEKVAEVTLTAQGDAKRGSELFKQQSCIACHTYANGQQPKGPHLVDIGKRYQRHELIESILKPDEKIAQGFDTYTFIMDSGKSYTGFVVSESAETLILRQTNGLPVELIQDQIEERAKQKTSMMPKGVVNNLTTQQLADLIAYLESLK